MRYVAAFFSFFILLASQATSALPKVLVSIAPIHQIVYAITDGVLVPELLIPPGQSAHHLSLTPSDARRLHEADLIIWVGPSLESFLSRPLDSLSRSPVTIALENISTLENLPQRNTIEWADSAEHDHDEHDHHAHEVEFTAIDPHLWLSTYNAAQIAEVVRDQLMLLDPANSIHYHNNTVAFINQLRALNAHLQTRLAPIKDKPYLVFHDAYQYFEHSYGLSSVGAMHLHPGAGLSVTRVNQIRDMIHGYGAVCIFKEPQFPNELIINILDGLDTRVGTLDPLGATIPPSLQGYSDLLNTIADGLIDCLAEPESSQR